MGRLPKSRIERKIARIEKARTKAALQAAAEWKRGASGQKKSVTDHIGRFIDSMAGKIDPLELVAIIALVPIVQHMIHQTDEFAKMASIPFKAFRWERLASALVSTFTFGMVRPEVALSEAEKVIMKSEGFLADWSEWLLAFAISFVVVRHPEIMIGGLKVLVGSFMAGLSAL